MDIILLELILVVVVALGLGFWQLYDVNKALKDDHSQDSHQCMHDKQKPAEKHEKTHRDAG